MIDTVFFLKAYCSTHKRPFYIRYDLAADGLWCESYGLKELPKEYEAKFKSGSGSKSLDITNSRTGPMYKCPWCDNRFWFRHGSDPSCRVISCYDGVSKEAVCGACGTTCTLGGGYITEIDGTIGSGQ